MTYENNSNEFLKSMDESHDSFWIMTDSEIYQSGPAYERVMVIDTVWGPLRLHLRIDQGPAKSHCHVSTWTEVGWKMIHSLPSGRYWNGQPSADRVRSGSGDPERTTLRAFQRLMDEAWPVINSAMQSLEPANS